MNRAKQIPVITITVVDKMEGYSVEYHMYNDRSAKKKTHTFIAKSTQDQAVIQQMVVGNSYQVNQTVFGPLTRWDSAKLIGMRQPQTSPIKITVRRSLDGKKEHEEYLKSLGIEF